ncbi:MULTISPECIES: hypothetical protein [Acinetobacter]|nr:MULTISPECIES: hypothetical protein [Gammaproteobacteria]MDG3558496.1 hypothetical protein [Acinetobacter bereziniae]MDI9746092.1 hypothetical protein [Acinetobacter nosocomialis]
MVSFIHHKPMTAARKSVDALDGDSTFAVPRMATALFSPAIIPL